MDIYIQAGAHLLARVTSGEQVAELRVGVLDIDG